MKKKLPYIIIALLILSQFFTNYRMNELENRISTQNSNMYNIEQNLSSNIGSIYQNVDDMLAEEASIIHAATKECGELDADTLSLPITFTVEPKQVSETMTVSLKFADETLLLTKDDTIYTGQKNFPLNDDKIEPTIIIEDNGVKSITQDNGLNLYSLVENYVPRIFPMYYGGSTSWRSGSDVKTYTQNGELSLEPISKYSDKNAYKDAKLVSYIDGVMVDSVELDLSEFEAGNTVRPIDKEYELRDGQIFSTFLIMTDNLGLMQQYPLEYFITGSDTRLEPWYEFVKITAPNGEVIYENKDINDEFLCEFGFELEFPY